MLPTKSSNQLWQLYLQQVRSRKMPSLEALGLTTLQSSNERGFVGQPEGSSNAMLDDTKTKKLLEFYAQAANKFVGLSDYRRRPAEANLVNLGVAFVNAGAHIHGLKFLKEAHALGFPINFQHPSHLGTALHTACFTNEEAKIKWLISTGECDYPLLDKYERSAVDLIQLEHPYNEELLDELHMLTYKAATEKGIDYAKNKRERVRRWHQSDWYHDHLDRIGRDRIYVNDLD